MRLAMSQTIDQSMNEGDDQNSSVSDGKHPGGRPLLFETVEELQVKIDAYFADCNPHPEQYIAYEYPKKTIADKDGKGIELDDYEQRPTEKFFWHISQQKPYTVTGLANFLNTSRETLINYQKRGEFFDTIKAAKDKCEHYWELQLLGPHATGPIFNLKNNFEWRDKSEQEVNHSGGVILSDTQAEQLIRARRNRSDS